jgi:hypothetical protein
MLIRNSWVQYYHHNCIGFVTLECFLAVEMNSAMVYTNILRRKSKILKMVLVVWVVWPLLSLPASSCPSLNLFLFCDQAHLPSSSPLPFVPSFLPSFLASQSHQNTKQKQQQKNSFTHQRTHLTNHYVSGWRHTRPSAGFERKRELDSPPIHSGTSCLIEQTDMCSDPLQQDTRGFGKQRSWCGGGISPGLGHSGLPSRDMWHLSWAWRKRWNLAAWGSGEGASHRNHRGINHQAGKIKNKGVGEWLK